MMTETVELASTPRLGRLYGRAAAGMLSGMLPGRATRTGAGVRDGDRADVPDVELVLHGARVDLHRLADYARVCGFPLTGSLPATYPHVLAFPLALSLMTRPEFPFPAAGAVHLANRITQYRRLPVEQPLDLTVRAEDLRPHPRGRQVDVVAEARVDGELVWRDVSTYLHKSGASSSQEGAPSSSSSQGGAPVQAGAVSGAPSWEGAPTAVWRIGARVGRDYAAVSGDRNPIHTSTLAAKVFGFRRRIAHGMWTKARCLAQLVPRLPEAYEVSVRFAAPILLPSTVHFTASTVDEGGTVAVHSPSGRPHLTGEIAPLSG